LALFVDADLECSEEVTSAEQPKRRRPGLAEGDQRGEALTQDGQLDFELPSRHIIADALGGGCATGVESEAEVLCELCVEERAVGARVDQANCVDGPFSGAETHRQVRPLRATGELPIRLGVVVLDAEGHA
jgi:hypothetical protein